MYKKEKLWIKNITNLSIRFKSVKDYKMQIHKLLSKKDITNFLAYFLGFYLIILLARFFTTAGHLNLFMWQGYQLLFALAFASSSVLFKYQKKHTLLFLFVALLWGASCLCKIGANMVLN